MKKWGLIFIVIGLFAALLCCAQKEQQSVKSTAIPVTVTTAQKVEQSKPVRKSGILGSDEESKLSFKVGGIIDAILVNEGEFVRKGQILAKLKLDEMDAYVQQAQNGFDKAERDYNRVKNLYADSVATLEQLQNAETGKNVAKSQLEIATFNKRFAKITAPFSGQVLKILAEENEMIGQGYPVFYFGATQQEWTIKCGVADKDVLKLAVGDSAQIKMDAFPEQSFTGKITEIAGAPDMGNNLYQVKVTIDQPDPQFKSGFIASVVLYPSQKQVLTKVPFESLVEVSGRDGFLFSVHNDSIAKKLPIRLSFIDGNSALVSKGIKDGQKIIVKGAPYLTDGNIISIKGEERQ